MALVGLPRGITWDDFTEVEEQPAGEHEAAYTKARWNLSWGFPSGIGDYTVANVNITVEMLRDESWVVSGSKTAALLRHEQGHYDITALGARDLHRELPRLRSPTESGLRTAVRNLENRIKAEVAAMNVRYDGTSGGTNHGQDSAAQTRWNGTIATAISDPDATLSSIVPSSP